MELDLEAGERYIPFRRSDIVSICAQDGRLSDEQSAAFRSCCEILISLFHFELHKTLEELKDYYAFFDPDRDTRLANNELLDIQKFQTQLETRLTDILVKANYEPVSKHDLNQAMGLESLFKVRLHVDFNDFDEVLFFRRGSKRKTEVVRTFFGLLKRPIELVMYDRVVVYVRFKNSEYFQEQERTDLFFEPGSTLIKLFRNVPKNDLEMLFPNTEVRMKLLDKLIIAVPTAVGGIFMLVTKLGSALLLVVAVLAFWLGLREQPVSIEQSALIALGVGMAGLASFLWRQFSKYKNRKIRFMKQLAENLYFKNLDNNAGVFHNLIDAAEEEESKEAILAYYHLLIAKQAIRKEDLDQQIENWFRERQGCVVDFEIEDALGKLVRLQLVTTKEGMYKAVPLIEANRRLDKIWDDYFQFGLEPTQ